MSEATMDKDHEELDEKDEGEEEAPSSERGKASKGVDAPTSQVQAPHSAFRNVLTIAKRELASYFNSPLAYIVISLSIAVFGIHFFLYQGGIWQIDRASMVRLFSFVPYVLCIFAVPLFTMRSMSEEKRLGTIELLITLPVKDSEVILGKFVGAFGMVFLQIALLAFFPLVMFVWPWHLGAFDWGPFWSAMLGLSLMSAAATSIGIMFSGFTESQILSFFLSAVTLAALFAVGQLVQLVGGWYGDVIAFFSFDTQYEPFSRGVIDTRAVLYFLSVAVIGLLVAFRTLESRKWS